MSPHDVMSRDPEIEQTLEHPSSPFPTKVSFCDFSSWYSWQSHPPKTDAHFLARAPSMRCLVLMRCGRPEGSA